MTEFTAPSLVRQNILGFGSQVAGFFSNLIFNIVLPIWMGATLFGILSLSLGFSYILVGLFDVGFNMTAIKFISSYSSRKKYKEVRSIFFYLLKLKIAIALIFSIILFIFSDIISSFYGIPELSLTFKVVSPLIVFYAFFTFMSNVYVGLQKNQYSLIGNITNSIGLVIFPLIFFLAGLGLEGVVAAVVISFIIASVIISLPLMIKLRFILSKPKSRIKRNKLNMNIFYFTILSFLNLFLYWGILVLLGFFVLPQEVAFFKISLSLFMAVGILIPISNIVVFSSVIGIKSIKDTRKLKAYMSKVIQYGSIVIFPAMFGLYILGENLVQVIYGKEFILAGFSLEILCWALIAQFVTNLFYSYLAESRLKEVSKIYALSAIVGIIFSIPAMTYFGLFGASLSFVFIYFLIFALLYVPVYRNLKINFFKYMYKPLIASIIMAGVVFYLEPFVHSLLEGLLLILFGIIFYFAVLYSIKGVTKKDLFILRYIYK